MRICFVNSEIFSSFTGYSRLNKIVGQELIRRGIEVFVLVPQIKGKRKIEQFDGMTILSFRFPSLKLLFSREFFRLPEADIYEIWDPYMPFSYFIVHSTPNNKHVIAFADPHEWSDFKDIMQVDPKLTSLRRNSSLRIPYVAYYPYLRYVRPYLAQRTISKADAYFYEAKFLLPKIQRMHNLKTPPVLVPHIAEISEYKPVKTAKPTVCYLAHWGEKKRPELFFDLARQFPEVKFIAMGRAVDENRDRELRENGAHIPNLEMTGVISEEDKRSILERSWILISTAVHEGLPQAFIEACACRCAILSAVNPDDYASNFGYHVQDDDFKSGLEYLLENDRWREQGEKGFQYVRENNDINKVIDRRIEVYESLLGKK